MAPDSNGQPERICSLSGPRDAICRAKELIMNIVHQRGRTEGYGPMGDLLGPGSGGGGGGGGGGGPMGPGGPGGPGGHGGGGGGGGGGGPGGPVGPGGVAHVEIMVPGPKVGLIIGKGGETIKQLQEKSGAKMVVIQDGPNQEQEKPLRISGDPQKVEYAKQLVYDLIAEKEMQAYSRRGGRNERNDESGGGRGPPGMGGPGGYNEYGGPGGGGGEGVEVAVPRAAVGVVIGKGGDMIKKIQAETGARVQFQQGRDEGPGDRRCLLTGKSQNVDMARQRIEELIDSVIVSIFFCLLTVLHYYMINSCSVAMTGAPTTEGVGHLVEAETSAMTAATIEEEVVTIAWEDLEVLATEIMNTGAEITIKVAVGATGTSPKWK